MPAYKTELETIHLDSGYYIEIPKDIALGRPPGESKPEQFGQESAGEEDQEYIEGPKGIVLGRPPGGNNQQQIGQVYAGEEGQVGTTVDKSSMLIAVQHTKGVTCKLEMREDDNMEDLHHNIHKWYSVPPGEQRILWEGLPLPPDIKLSSVGNGVTLMVVRGMHGGAAT